MSFVADQKIQQIAEAYARDAVDVARRNFGVSLDWGDASVGQVEEILGTLHASGARARPGEYVSYFAKIFGSYLGEVFRRNHGATWGVVTLDRAECPGLQGFQGTVCWPWDRVRSRIVSGPDDNVWHYYLTLLERERSDAPVAEALAALSARELRGS